MGYGEVGGTRLDAGALGESEFYLKKYSYSQLRNALRADAKTKDDSAAVATLPSRDPTNGGSYWLTTADAKALLLGHSSGVDGYVGFSSGAPFDYGRSNGVTAGQYDFYAVVAHEFSEVMGRALLTGENNWGQPTSGSSLA